LFNSFSGSEMKKTAYNYSLPPLQSQRRQAMSVVRHRRERQIFGQMAAAIRHALPATASADPEPLTNGL
jgi:hypothetical protein